MQEKNYPSSIGVIISTYNHPEWLRKTLWAYACQTFPPDELIIADDGSDERTKTLIAEFKETYFPQIQHIWHSDNGFQKCKILNFALATARSEYLIFTDQDCIPRKDFIETHASYATKGCILSGGYFKLPLSISKQITKEDILSGNVFHLAWLKDQGLTGSFKNIKLIQSPIFSLLMNQITPTKATWNGCNSSGWKADFLQVKGFDERMKYGGEDREFGERLFNMGIRSKQIRYSAICLHLDHDRPYKNQEAIAENKAIRRETHRTRVIQTNHGL